MKHESHVDEIIAAFLEAEQAGTAPSPEQWLEQHPEHADELKSFFANRNHLQQIAGHATETIPPNTPALPSQNKTIQYFGDYELLNEIARGGMGVVFKARQKSLRRVVALKMILAGQLAGDDEVQRFRTEAQAAANLQHPNIVAIHEVGEHDGQQYFSMDFVEGQSLADMVRAHPLPPMEAARLVQTVAEAIDYAHQQGTLHRDLKPANILVDAFGQPRVTDFGLAKRLGDKGLTATGAVLGTPSYMPPEQASGDQAQVGPVSDVYALGAVLYELVTGRPPFQAATALDTILQVMDVNPVSPRSLNPVLSRDLETIILKCLEKEPAKRYASAADLAADLAAYREGRPIQARRPTWEEQLGRWMQRHRRSLLAAMLAVLATALLVGGSVFGWNLYEESQHGRFDFSSEGPPLTAEIVPVDEEEAIAKVTIPTQKPVLLRHGKYRLTLSAKHRLSETFQMTAEARRLRKLRIDLKHRLLWEPLRAPQVFALVDFSPMGTDNDFVFVSRRGLQRVDGRTGELLWAVDLDPKKHPALNKWGRIIVTLSDQEDKYGLQAESKRIGSLTDLLAAQYRGDYPKVNVPLSVKGIPEVVQPAPDIDGDGVADLIWCSRNSSSLLAVSGADGHVLWWHPFVGAAKPPFAGVQINGGAIAENVALLPAKTVPNSNGPVLIATTFCRGGHFASSKNDWHEFKPGQWIEAIAVKTGETLWRHELPKNRQAFFAAEVHSIDSKSTVLCCSGSQLIGLDVRSGKPLWVPRDLGGTPLDRPRFVDLNLDGKLDVLLLIEAPKGQLAARAVTVSDGNALWQKTVPVDWIARSSTIPPTWEQRLRDRPQVIGPGGDSPALAGDSRVTLVLPYSSNPSQPGSLFPTISPKPFGVMVWDGATGKELWRTPPLPQRKIKSHGPRRFRVGPDLDGDGCRDIFRALVLAIDDPRRASDWPYLHIDALSGANGKVLWTLYQPFQQFYPFLHRDDCVAPLNWLPHGPDGWPMLIVPIANQVQQIKTVLVSATDGRILYEIPALGDLLPPADVDGDQLPDLIGTTPAEIQKRYDWHRLHAVRMYSPEVWRRFGHWQTTADLNGDEIGDLVQLADGPVTTISGKEGRLLWQSSTSESFLGSQIGTRHGERKLGRVAATFALPESDIDTDGCVDLLVFKQFDTSSPYSFYTRVLSGRTGKSLWQTELPGNVGDRLFPQVECRDIDKDGQSELLFVSSVADYKRPTKRFLNVLSSKTGAVRWRREVGPHQDHTYPAPWTVSDVNGDGILDVVQSRCFSNESHRKEIAAFDGRDGRLLWSKRVWLPRRESRDFVIGDLDNDGRSDVILLGQEKREDEAVTLFVFGGQDGRVLKRWDVADNKAVFLTRTSLVVPNQKTPGTIVVRLQGLLRLKKKGTESFEKIYTFSFGNAKSVWQHKLKPERRDGVRIRRFAKDIEYLWRHDVTGDGFDELLRFEENRLVAFRVDGRTLWRSPALFAELETLHTILPAEKSHGVIVAKSSDTVWGIAAKSGRPVWRCDGPGELLAVVPDKTRKAGPRLLFVVNDQFHACRLTLPVDANGNYRLGENTLPIAITGEHTHYIALPWARLHGSNLVIAVIMCIAFFGLLGWLTVTRRWEWLFTLLICYVLFAVAVCTMAWYWDARLPWEQYDWTGWFWALLFPFCQVGALVFVLVFLAALWTALRTSIRLRPWHAVVGMLLAPFSLLVLGGVVLYVLIRAVRRRRGKVAGQTS